MPDTFNPVIPEHRFWLQLLGDKARFVENGLYPDETAEVAAARRFIALLDGLLERSRQDLPESALIEFNGQAFLAAQDFRKFLLHIIKRLISEKIMINMVPGFLNGFVDETEQYLNILSAYMHNTVPSINSVNETLVWMSILYASAVRFEETIGISFIEYRRKAERFGEDFRILYMKANITKGLLRTGVKNLPALDQLNDDIQNKMTEFAEFIVDLMKMVRNKRMLGNLTYLNLDSVYRQLCYYMTKMAAVSSIKAPVCDPAASRRES